MDLNSEILRRDARAPLCIDALPRARYEHAFRAALRQFLPEESALLAEGVDCLSSHHACAQEFVVAVDRAIVAAAPDAAVLRGVLMGLLGACRGLAALAGRERVLEDVREALAERFPCGEGVLPEFCWEKGAGVLFLEKVKTVAVREQKLEEGVAVHLDAVYDDCARTVQLGLWVMAAAWRAEVVDAWLFESAYTFFRHTLPHHVCGPQGLAELLPRIIGELRGGG
jgi:hypothetical protein